MTDQEFRQLGPPLIWDNSMRSTLYKCPRKFYWFLRGYVSETKESFFSYGSAIHKALELWHSTYDKEEAETSLTKLWIDSGAQDKGLDNLQGLITKFRRYTDAYGQEESFKVLQAEQGWKLPLSQNIHGLPIQLGGSIDAEILWLPTNEVMVREDKTTGGYLSDSYVEQWSYSTQVTGYCWYAFKTDKTPSCIINMMTKNTPGPRSKWSTPEFFRLHIFKNPVELSTFEDDFITEISNFISHYWDKRHWPMSGRTDSRNCTGGMGISRCPYITLCKTDSIYNYTEIEPLELTTVLQLRKTSWEPWKRGKTECLTLF